MEGVESEQELESSLVNSEAVQPPITLSTTISGVQVDTQTGCLLGGAGELLYYYWNNGHVWDQPFYHFIERFPLIRVYIKGSN